MYTVQPFRLSSWRAGLYLATAMFYNTTSAQGLIRGEVVVMVVVVVVMVVMVVVDASGYSLLIFKS